MVLEDIVRSPHRRALARQAPLGSIIDGFVAATSSVGYTPVSLGDLLVGVIGFGAFLQGQGVTDIRQLTDRHVEAFIATQPVVPCLGGRYRYPASRGVRGARHLLKYARAAGLTRPEPPSPGPVYAAVLEGGCRSWNTTAVWRPRA